MNTMGRNNLGAGNKGKLRIQASAGELVKSFALALSFAGSLLGATNANALVCTSAATGNWSVAATWAAPCNVVGGPVAADTVTIAAAHTVTVDVNSAATSIAVTAPSVATHGININSGIVLSVSGAITMTAPAVNLRTSTFAVGTGTLNAGSIAIGGGTGTKISQVTVGATGIVNVTGAVTTSGTAAQSRFIATGASTITIGGNFGPGAFTPGASTLTVSGNFTPTAMVASTGTVIFAGGVAQTMRALTTYNNVTVNKSVGALSLLGTTTIGGALSVDAGTFTVGAFTLTVTGATAVSSVLDITSATGTKTFVGAVTVNPGGTWTNTTEAVTFRGGVTYNGAVFTAGTGVYTFDTTAAQSINCATALIIPSLSVTSPTVLTNNCNLTVSTALAGTGNLANAATLNIAGTSAITTLTATAAGNIVNYTGAAQTAKVTTYSNLTLSGSGAKTFATTPTVNGILSMEGTATVSVAPTYGAAATLQYNTATARTAGVEWITPFAASGGVIIANTGAITLNASKVLNASVTLTLGANNLTTGANILTLAASCAANGGDGSLSRTSGYVIGNLQLTFPTTTSTCIYHVGDSTGYAPMTVTLGATTGGTLTGRVDTGDHPDTTSSGSGIDATKSANHYWTLTAGTLPPNVTYAATFQFCANTGSCTVTEVDAGANTSNFMVALKSAGIWSTQTAGTRNAYSTQATGISSFGEFAVGEISTNNCFSDSFTGADNSSPGTNWSVGNKTGAFGNPVIFGNRLRLTNATTGVATWATLQRMMPAAGNKVTLEFDHFAYGGTHADGIGVILSDASVAPQAGAFGGSLGYAQKGYTPISDCTTVGGCPGFAGGWLGIGVDEYGNYSASTEGRNGGSVAAIVNSVAIRGSGSGMSGYRFLQGTTTLSPNVDSVAVLVPPHRYRIVVDHTDGVHAWTSVERDTTGGGTAYTILIGCPPGVTSGCTALDVKDPGYSQNAVPASWNLSFTGSTGALTNIHEIDNLSICTVQGLATPSLHHIKIEHGGAACTNSPATVIVKACADATCSSLYMNSVTVSLSTTGGTWAPVSPITFSGGQATVTLTDATVRTDTLGATATAPTAADATVCSPTCSLSFAACTFDVIEVGAAANTPIFTKLASTAFNLDVLKLSAGNQSVTAVALVDASSGACSTYALLANTSTALPSAFSNATPRKPFSFTYANAAPNVRVRVTTAGPNYSCSSDNFAIRPQSFAVASSATQTGSTGTPVFRAGTDTFALTATAATNLYTGTPKLNSSLVATSLANLGTLASVAFPPAALGVSTANGFTYSEVGNFGLSQYAVYDDTFAQVDSVKGECTSGFSNTVDANGKFSCQFGSAAAGPFGRFVPDHFTVVGDISNACAAGAITYMGQPAPLSAANVVEARNAANGVTKNYVLPYASGIVSLGAENADNGTDLSARFTPSLAGSWILGAYTLASASATFTRPATTTSDATWGSFESLDIGLTVTDVDVSTVPAVSGADMNPAAAGGSSFTYKKFAGSPLRMRFGRLKLSNAHGSELLRLPVQIQAQYWNGTGFATNTADNCTVLSAANIALGNYQRNTGDTWTTSPTLANAAAIAGMWQVNLAKPGATFTGMGSVNVCVDLGSDPVGGTVCAATIANLPYLQGLWSPGTSYDNDPTARATFGVYKGNNEFIYLRESY